MSKNIVGLNDNNLLSSTAVYDTNQSKTQADVNALLSGLIKIETTTYDIENLQPNYEVSFRYPTSLDGYTLLCVFPQIWGNCSSGALVDFLSGDCYIRNLHTMAATVHATIYSVFIKNGVVG